MPCLSSTSIRRFLKTGAGLERKNMANDLFEMTAQKHVALHLHHSSNDYSAVISSRYPKPHGCCKEVGDGKGNLAPTHT